MDTSSSKEQIKTIQSFTQTFFEHVFENKRNDQLVDVFSEFMSALDTCTKSPSFELKAPLKNPKNIST
jgi:hypothetical protein